MCLNPHRVSWRRKFIPPQLLAAIRCFRMHDRRSRSPKTSFLTNIDNLVSQRLRNWIYVSLILIAIASATACSIIKSIELHSADTYLARSSALYLQEVEKTLEAMQKQILDNDLENAQAALSKIETDLDMFYTKKNMFYTEKSPEKERVKNVRALFERNYLMLNRAVEVEIGPPPVVEHGVVEEVAHFMNSAGLDALKNHIEYQEWSQFSWITDTEGKRYWTIDVRFRFIGPSGAPVQRLDRFYVRDNQVVNFDKIEELNRWLVKPTMPVSRH